jgi:hypothetical protein
VRIDFSSHLGYNGVVTKAAIDGPRVRRTSASEQEERALPHRHLLGHQAGDRRHHKEETWVSTRIETQRTFDYRREAPSDRASAGGAVAGKHHQSAKTSLEQQERIRTQANVNGADATLRRRQERVRSSE